METARLVGAGTRLAHLLVVVATVFIAMVLTVFVVAAILVAAVFASAIFCVVLFVLIVFHKNLLLKSSRFNVFVVFRSLWIIV